MSVALTREQQAELDTTAGRPTELVDPQTGERFRLVPADEYERLRDLADGNAFARAAARALGKQLARDGA